jgi:hypothetical protein
LCAASDSAKEALAEDEDEDEDEDEEEEEEEARRADAPERVCLMSSRASSPRTLTALGRLAKSCIASARLNQFSVRMRRLN